MELIFEVSSLVCTSIKNIKIIMKKKKFAEKTVKLIFFGTTYFNGKKFVFKFLIVAVVNYMYRERKNNEKKITWIEK